MSAEGNDRKSKESEPRHTEGGGEAGQSGLEMRTGGLGAPSSHSLFFFLLRAEFRLKIIDLIH